MRKSLSRILPVILCTTLLVSGCSKNNDPGLPCSTAWATELQAEINAVVAASTAYGLDQSEANCNALKAAYQDYVDALKPYGNCEAFTGQDREDWQQALDEAEANIDSTC